MNLNKDLYLNRDYVIKRKPRIDLNIYPTGKKIYYPNQNKIQNRYSKRTKDYFFENFNAINNGKIINNIITPLDKSYFTEHNQSQINRDIYGYNNYIINKNSFNTITFSDKKNHKSKQESISNFNYSDTPNYLTTYESNSNLKFNGINNYESQHQYQTTNPNNNENSFNNSDIKFMNMKLNFKILQQKLTHLNDIASSTEKNIYKTPFKINMNTLTAYNSAIKANNYPIKVFRSEIINNNNNRLKKIVNKKKKENEILKQKNNRNYDIINNNIQKMRSHILNKNIISDNKKNEFELIRSKINSKKERLHWKERYFTNDNSLTKNYKKDESELSQLADNILAINKSSENLENNYFIKEKSFDTPDIKNILQKKNNIIKNKNKNNQYKYISNELEEISINKEHNQTEYNNDQNLNLMIEHIFSYNSSENKKELTEKNTDKGKANRRNKNNKNINIVQTNNFILNHLTEDLGNKREKSPKNENTYTNINLNKDNKISDFKNNEDELNDDNDNNTEDDGDKIINSLIATASQNFKKVKELTTNNSITDFDKNFMKESNSKKQNNKKVSFEDELIYINYNQNYKVTNLHITDDDNKTIPFKPKDMSKYIKKLTSNNNRLKPIIINANKANYNNIINKIKIKNTNSKINKIKTNQIIKKNIDYIKEVEKRNNSKDKSRSKEKYKNKDVFTNSINIKINKSKINNKLTVNKK